MDAVVSGAGAPPLADAWHIDLTLGGSQKCLSAPPSMTFLAVSPQAWEVIETVNYAGYDALKPWRNVAANGACPCLPYWQGTEVSHRAAGLI